MTPRHGLDDYLTNPARFSRRWWLDSARNLLWIFLITLLIWIYADIEFTDTITMNATLSLNTGGSRKVILVSQHDYPLNFELAGSQTALEMFRQTLIDNDSVINYNIAQDYGPGEVIVPSADLIRRAANLQELGLTIKRVDPEAVALELQKLVPVQDVPVSLETIGGALEKPVESRRIDLYLPEPTWQDVRARLGDRQPQLKTKVVDLRRFPAGQDVTVEAEIVPVMAGVSLPPIQRTVRFTLQVASQTDTREIPVSVQILTPAAWAEEEDSTWQEYVLVRQAPADWRPKLQIAGAKKDLQGENVIAYVPLGDDDKKPVESWLERDVTVRFRTGTTLKLIGPSPKVRFRLERRKPAATTVP
jgi:hypothetical protein